MAVPLVVGYIYRERERGVVVYMYITQGVVVYYISINI